MANLRKYYDNDPGDPMPLTVDGRVYKAYDHFLIGEIGLRDAAILEFIYQTVEDKFVYLILVGAEGLSFGDLHKGFTVTRYVPKDYALALRAAWEIVRPQPDMRDVEGYFRRIKASQSP